MPDGVMTLDEVAQELGVHYQTAYKWVRSGSLRAVRVGGAYRIEPDDLSKFVDDRNRAEPPPKRRPRQGFDRLATRLNAFLVEGDEGGARALIADLVGDGLSVTEVSQEVIVPAMRAIGDGWHAGTVPIWAEHRATAIVERLLGERLPNPRGRRRGRAVVAALSGDRHVLPTTLAMVALRDDNWHVDHLGADVPADEIERFARTEEVDLVVLSVTETSGSEPAAELAGRLERDGIRVLLGGPGKTLADLQELARNK